MIREKERCDKEVVYSVLLFEYLLRLYIHLYLYDEYIEY